MHFSFVYATFLFKIAEAFRPKQNAESGGTFMKWSDAGYAFGVVIASITAYLFVVEHATLIIAGLAIYLVLSLNCLGVLLSKRIRIDYNRCKTGKKSTQLIWCFVF